jgi:hypothetical protein
MSTVTRKLIAKELYLNRWLVIGASVSGLLSILIAATGKTGFNVGALTWLTTVIALGVILVVYGVRYERKEHSLLFVMSLPLSIADYVRAKMIGLALCFFIPWLLSSAAALTLLLVKADLPDGLVPFTVLLCVYMLANFAVVLCGALQATSEAVVSVVIIVTNTAVSLYIFGVSGVPELHDHMFGPVPVWNSTFWTVLAIELGVLALAVSIPFFLAARRRDFI